MTTGVWMAVRKVERSRLHALKQSQASALAHQVERKMANLEQALRGASGYLGRGPLPTRSEWRAYVERLDLPMAYPGVQGFSFVEWIPRPNLPDHLRRVRREGFPDYAVVPGGSAGPLLEGVSAILYLEPMNAENQQAFGKDMLEDSTRRQAMLQARDTGQVVTSGPLVLYQDANGKPQPGVVLFGPVFREGQPVTTVAERRAALRGWATIPLRMEDFIRSVLTQSQPQAELRLFDSELGAGNQIYDSDPSHPVDGMACPWTLKIPGRTWVARIEPGPDFHRHVGHPRHWQFLLAGMVISLLVFTLLIFQTGAEARAQLLARLRGEALLASEAQFRALFERAPFGMAIVDSGSGRFLTVNAHLGEIFGYTPDELLTRTFQSLTHPDHLEADLASVRELASGAVPVIHKEKRYLHRDGHEVWARLSMVKLPVPVGAPARHLSMVEDITEARGREAQLRASEQRFHEVFDLSPDPMTLTRLSDGLLVEVNQAWCDLTGISREENLGRSTTELELWPRPEEREAFVAALRQAGAYGPAEITLKGRDGLEHQLLVTAKRMVVAGEPCFLSMGKDVTQRHEMEQALRRSEADLALAQEIGDFGSWHVVYAGGEGTWFVSDGLRRLYGYGPGQPITMQTGFEVMHPEDRAFAQSAWEAAIAGSGPCEWEHRIIVGGEVRWMAVRVQFQFSPDGQVQEASGINQDVTRRRATEEALRLSESRLRILGDQLPDSFLYQFLSRPGEAPRFLHITAGVERLCGLKAHEVMRDPDVLFSTVDPVQMPAYLEAEAASARDLKPFAMDLRQRHTDGHWRWFRVRSLPRPQTDGSVIWEGISTDVTERLESRLRLEESEARFRAVIEDGPVPLFLHRDGRFVYLNPASLRLLKAHAAEDLIGQQVLDRVHPDDRAQVVERIRLTLDTGAEAPLQEVRLIAMDGTVLQVETLGRVLHLDGQATMLVFAQDVSVRKQAEAMEFRAQKAESLVLMAGSIAHDFNNIFQGVLGFIEVARIRAGQNLEVSQMLGKAEGSLRKAIGLSWKMLDFSGRALVKQEPLDLEAWLPAFAATLQLELPATLLLDVSCAPVPFILGDRVRLEEVMQALLANAREAAGPLAARVRVRLFTDFGTDRPGPGSPGTWPLARPDLPATVCLEVADSGPGVAAAILDRICDPFFTTHAMGRGLGLASVTGILQGHRAGLHLFNGEQGGLVVRMHFPPGGA